MNENKIIIISDVQVFSVHLLPFILMLFNHNLLNIDMFEIKSAFCKPFLRTSKRSFLLGERHGYGTFNNIIQWYY